MAKFNFPGRIVHSRNFWDGGATAKARNWRISLAAKERNTMHLYFMSKEAMGSIPLPPYTIKLIRKYPSNPSNPLYKRQRVYDDDNISGGLKHVRDGIAKGLGYKSDSHPDLQWKYDQVKTKDKQELTVIIKTRR